MNRFVHTPTSKFGAFRSLASSSSSTAATTSSSTTANSDVHPLHILWHYQILAPDSYIVTYWNYIFLATGIISLFIDPLYFYLPYIGGPGCLSTDSRLGVLITLARSVADFFYLLHMIMKFRTAFVAPNSRVFGRGELVMDAREIAVRYLKSDFLIDLAALLPLPQIVIWLVIPATRDSGADHANNTLAFIVLFQYVPRLFQIFPLNNRIIKTTGFVAKTAWTGAIYNLLLYMLASHVFGASWYLFAMGRQFSCWQFECTKEHRDKLLDCIPAFLDCNSVNQPERQYWLNVTSVVSSCDAKSRDVHFKFGIFADAFINDVVSSTFIEKYLYCLWWGLRTLSSYGQTLETSIFLGENLFCLVICIGGLTLFSLLIGNMQTSLQSMMVRVEEWRIKRRDTEEWMRHRQLPPDLQERVHKFVQYKWLATRGVDEEFILHSLPVDLRREIQRHLCLALVRRVPFFSQMDDQLLDAICERLVSSLSTQGTSIFQEGDPVDEMLFIIRGQLESSTTNGGRSGFFNSITLRPGDFCGEELLTWALMPNSSLNLPSSTRTVKALCEVEAFALRAEDLKFVAHQFKRLQSMKLQHVFRYYSHQWRTWASCFIQAAWRKYKKRKMARELAIQESFGLIPGYEQESGYINEADRYYEETGGSSADNANNAHLGVTFLASKFAANTRRGNQRKSTVVGSTSASSSLKMPQLFKPDEPNFCMDPEDV